MELMPSKPMAGNPTGQSQLFGGGPQPAPSADDGDHAGGFNPEPPLSRQGFTDCPRCWPGKRWTVIDGRCHARACIGQPRLSDE